MVKKKGGGKKKKSAKAKEEYLPPIYNLPQFEVKLIEN